MRIAQLALLWIAVATFSHAATWEDMANVRYFAVGGVGYAGIASEGEILFRELYARSDNVAQFTGLVTDGNAPAQIYGLIGLYYLDRPAYTRMKRQLKPRQISTMSGCLMGSTSSSGLLSFIEIGFFQHLIASSANAPKASAANTSPSWLLTPANEDPAAAKAPLANWLEHADVFAAPSTPVLHPLSVPVFRH